jgi:predicted ATPase
VLTVEEIASRLHDRFHLLIGGNESTSTRHRTLRATMDSSFELLTPRAQVLLRRLGCFAGGATLEAIEAICAGGGQPASGLLDVVAELVDKSFLLFDRDGTRGAVSDA